MNAPLSQSGHADYAPSHFPPDFQIFLQPWCRRRKGGRSTWVIIEMFIKCQCTVGVRGKNLSATGYSCNVLLAQKCLNQCTLYTSGFYNWQIYEVSWICMYFDLFLFVVAVAIAVWKSILWHFFLTACYNALAVQKILSCRHVYFFCIIFITFRVDFYR